VNGHKTFKIFDFWRSLSDRLYWCYSYILRLLWSQVSYIHLHLTRDEWVRKKLCSVRLYKVNKNYLHYR